ncbi:MAG: ribonuclease E inhibitor RraB [Flavobacteriales bacterium]|nr:ribonuclease E inhibitor RraB [Flavobacteriales bacterium]
MSLIKFEGISADPHPYVSEQDLDDSLFGQEFLSQFPVTHIKMLGEDPFLPRRIDFYFLTNSLIKAIALVKELNRRGYSADTFEMKTEPNITGIQGSTTEMSVAQVDVLGWAREMCELGYIYDCALDGWGMGIRIDREDFSDEQ